MIPTVSSHFFSQLPPALQPLLHSGILLASVSAVALNLFFNGYQRDERVVKMRAERRAARQADSSRAS